MKLNNKGITTVEVLICFVLVVIITASMYAIISSFNDKKAIESAREEINTYKNILTKDIQEDFVKIGVVGTSYVENGPDHILTCNMKDGTTRVLAIHQEFAKSDLHPGGSNSIDDKFTIKYGEEGNLIDYPLPDLGSSKNAKKHIVKDLSINENGIIIENIDNKILSIYIGFYHPDLYTRYAIDIVTPINSVFGDVQATKDESWDEFA